MEPTSMNIARLLFVVHLVGFAAYLGGAYAQLEFLKRSSRTGLAAAVRDEYERLCATTITKVELPALVAQIASGVVNLVLTPAWLKMGWMHGKLAVVGVLLVLSHIEMFNARAIVKLRASKGDGAKSEIESRKARHQRFGSVGTLLVMALVLLVGYGLK
jgi:putative membrane protein